ncbi:translational GTPase TypA [candidate division WWE3 bacterium CG_4_9_14_3_um_filter_41_6]|uniref:Translational GTPase TypA n=1 Tax=candidate division WWE3 bacterium CG_4_10_14_0_2_um_filter_41_14 TaxID=1975072 RepID=A0A2M7THP0_UNCKA|nr:MAG: translational GTPase TypA [candidate division WWE3 bacterium CG_4_10_14_0_2_um_filter_41_14]PJA39661.1 MAG: translational GTPase TypA [candidate division WWE3 bacterium CG_4_9_14_3_um_filter_41_6]
MAEINPQLIRNVAVIAHVDHGKTTIIDALLKQTKVFRENQHEMEETQILDSNTLERERGITISAKNCAITYKDYKINIIDTPGHADFSGEVERTLSMADGALLIIDAQEGPMPQTRFVLRKAIELNLSIIVVINKIDKQFARIPYVIEKTETLFLELAQLDDQLNFPILYAVGRDGSVFDELPNLPAPQGSVIPLLEKIIEHVPAPQNDTTGVFKMVISTLDYNVHEGQFVIGKIHSGTISPKQKVILAHDRYNPFTIERVFVSEGLSRTETTKGTAGDIIALTGISKARIGETVTDPSDPTSLPASAIGEPTLHMYLGANTSPFSGKEGEFTTTRQIEARLNKELETNLSLRVNKNSNGTYTISGRGELHLAILIETLRREGFELEIGKPEVITKEIDGKQCEPVEELSIIVPQQYVGAISQELGKRFAHLVHMTPVNDTEMEFVYNLPTRTLIGLRGLLLTLTKGTVVMSSQLTGYEPMGKSLPKLRPGVLIADSPGNALSYGLSAVQQRGATFIEPGTIVYEGMIIGQSLTDKDIAMNVCKGKKLTNMRSSSADMNVQLAPPTILSLEQSIDFLEQDELLEITPTNLRLRKKFLTDNERRKARRD